MIDLTNIAGCFPDVRCFASMAVQSNDIGFGGIMFFFAASFSGKD